MYLSLYTYCLQNAMLIDEDFANGIMGPRRINAASLLDAGIIQENLPAPSHRVQAWDFTTGNTPDIADSEIIHLYTPYTCDS